MNLVFFDPVNKTMFLGDSARPHTRTESLERFRFSLADKRVSHDRFNQTKHFESNLPIALHPIAPVVSKVGFKYRQPHEASRWTWAWLFPDAPGSGRTTIAGRFEAKLINGLFLPD